MLKGQFVYSKGQEGQPRRWTQSYLVFNICQTLPADNYDEYVHVDEVRKLLEERDVAEPKDAMKGLNVVQMPMIP